MVFQRENVKFVGICPLKAKTKSGMSEEKEKTMKENHKNGGKKMAVEI